MRLDDLRRIESHPRTPLAVLPTPLHPLKRLSEQFAGPELWIKRDDLTGLAGGGNKTRKLEFFVGDALASGADTLVTVGAIQSNHTRQTAAAAARAGLRCALLHNAWTPNAGPFYSRAGNVVLSAMLGAELWSDRTPRPLGDPGELEQLANELAGKGRRPYVIPGGASDHRLGGLGYAAAAAEITAQADALDIRFDAVVHCTGSSGTQAGLVAGFAALERKVDVVGVSDDEEAERKRSRVLRLANATLQELGSDKQVSESSVEVVVSDPHPYGVATQPILDAIHTFARAEGLIADPVYEGRALRGLIDLIRQERWRRGDRILLLHMGGTPAVHGYADRIWDGSLTRFERGTPVSQRAA